MTPSTPPDWAMKAAEEITQPVIQRPSSKFPDSWWFEDQAYLLREEATKTREDEVLFVARIIDTAITESRQEQPTTREAREVLQEAEDAIFRRVREQKQDISRLLRRGELADILDRTLHYTEHVALREAAEIMDNNGGHYEGCNRFHRVYGTPDHCDCGFDATMKALAALTTKGGEDA